jgi:hypothetical protein
MAKNIILVVMVALFFIGAALAVRSVFKRNDSVAYDSNYIWRVETDPVSNAATLVRGSKINGIRHDVNKLIVALNKHVEIMEATRSQGDGVKIDFPRIVLEKAEPQTTHIRIENDQYLTQTMGSSGAQDYLAMVTYTLTETPGVRSIDFMFHAGEHAMPGVYSRENFLSYTTVTGGGRKR